MLSNIPAKPLSITFLQVKSHLQTHHILHLLKTSLTLFSVFFLLLTCFDVSDAGAKNHTQKNKSHLIKHKKNFRKLERKKTHAKKPAKKTYAKVFEIKKPHKIFVKKSRVGKKKFRTSSRKIAVKKLATTPLPTNVVATRRYKSKSDLPTKSPSDLKISTPNKINIEEEEPISFYTKFSEKSSAVMQVNLGNSLVLNDGILAYSENGKTFLPFFEFCENIQFPIDPGNDYADVKGWFIDENRKFLFDLAKGKSVSNKKKYELTPDNVRVVGDEIYVELDLLQKWFPIKIAFSSLDQLLQINSTEKLPIEEDYERSQKWDKMDEAKQNPVKSYEVDLIKTPYRLAAVPLLDMRYSAQYEKSKTTGGNTDTSTQIFSTGDFLYFHNQAFVSFADSTMSNARLTSSRSDPDGKMLGPLKATSLSFGDIYTPEKPLVSRSRQGQGVVISNLPENYVAEDRITINGMMSAGWDVEIYRNDFLLDFKKVGADGTYSFPNIDLTSGLNTIKLVFYGPFGQKREEFRRYLLNENLLKKNRLYYNLAANKNEKNLFVVRNSTNSGNTTLLEDPKYGSIRRFGELTYGLTKNTTIAANFSSIPLDQAETQQHDYQGYSLRSSVFGVYGRYDSMQDVTDHAGADKTSLQTILFDYGIHWDRERYDKNFISEQNQFSIDPLLERTDLRLNGLLPIPFLTQKPDLILTRTQNKFSGNRIRTDSQGEVSTNIFSMLNVSQVLRQVYDERISDAGRKVTTGRTVSNLRIIQPLSIRNILSYDLGPKKALTSTNEGIDYNFGDGLGLNLNHTYSFPTNEARSTTSYAANINKAFKKYVLGLSGSYSGNGNYSTSLNIMTSLGYDAKYGAGIVSGAPITNNGVVSARVFLDSNNNDTYDKGEELLSGVEVAVSGSQKVRTNSKGVALLVGVPVDTVARLELDTSGLENPYWTAKKPEFDIITHAGAITHVEFPIAMTGDIDGIAKIRLDKNLENASNVELELIDAGGNIFRTTKSSYDGYYTFQAVPYGEYKIRTSVEQAKRLGLESNAAYDVTVSDTSPAQSGFNFEIELGYLGISDSAKTKTISPKATDQKTIKPESARPVDGTQKIESIPEKVEPVVAVPVEKKAEVKVKLSEVVLVGGESVKAALPQSRLVVKISAAEKAKITFPKIDLKKILNPDPEKSDLSIKNKIAEISQNIPQPKELEPVALLDLPPEPQLVIAVPSKKLSLKKMRTKLVANHKHAKAKNLKMGSAIKGFWEGIDEQLLEKKRIVSTDLAAPDSIRLDADANYSVERLEKIGRFLEKSAEGFYAKRKKALGKLTNKESAPALPILDAPKLDLFSDQIISDVNSGVTMREINLLGQKFDEKITSPQKVKLTKAAVNKKPATKVAKKAKGISKAKKPASKHVAKVSKKSDHKKHAIKKLSKKTKIISVGKGLDKHEVRKVSKKLARQYDVKKIKHSGKVVKAKVVKKHFVTKRHLKKTNSPKSNHPKEEHLRSKIIR